MWRQGEHVCIIGDTGSGKTYLETQILAYRQFVIVLKSKGEALQRGKEAVKFNGFKQIKSLREMGAANNHYILYPEPAKQRSEFARALAMVHHGGGWTVVVDELYYLTHRLNLEREIDTLLTQGSSEGITVVGGAQRPAQITRFAISQSIHCCFFMSDGRDVKIIVDATTSDIKPYFSQLKRYQFVYFNRLTRHIEIADAKHLDFLVKGNRKYI